MSAALARAEEALRPFGDPEAVTTRACRGCGAQAPVTSTGMDALRQCNAILMARDEMPLNETRIFACERCELKVRDAAAQANRDRVEEMRAIILDLKESVDPPSEKTMLDRLAQLGHPDIPGLLHAIGESKAEKKGGRR